MSFDTKYLNFPPFFNIDFPIFQGAFKFCPTILLHIIPYFLYGVPKFPVCTKSLVFKNVVSTWTITIQFLINMQLIVTENLYYNATFTVDHISFMERPNFILVDFVNSSIDHCHLFQCEWPLFLWSLKMLTSLLHLKLIPSISTLEKTCHFKIINIMSFFRDFWMTVTVAEFTKT